jgi:hypothetical protein
MYEKNAKTSLQAYTRVAGLAYIVVILLGIFSASAADPGLFIPSNGAATISRILAPELLFRLSVLSEIVMYALVVLLSLALYVVLRSVDSNLALLALLWRLGEAVIGGSTAVLSGLVPLVLMKHAGALDTAHLRSLAGVFFEVRDAGLDVVLIFIGVGGTLFCYLFFKSRYIPRLISAWGMATYLSMLFLAIASILMPDLSGSVKMALYAPGGIFEITIGAWLLIKGINVAQGDLRAAGAP